MPEHWARPLSHKVYLFQPAVAKSEYKPPPRPPPLKKAAPPKAAATLAAELQQAAADLRAEADELDRVAQKNKKMQNDLGIKLGLLLCDQVSPGAPWDEGIKETIKLWGCSSQKGISKAEFRLALRASNLEATGAESDALFEKMDEDGGGKLDPDELFIALEMLLDAAEGWRDNPDANSMRARTLRKRAEVADAAAAASEEAEALEQEVVAMTEEISNNVAVQLGMLLFKRGIKPGVVRTWSTARGDHAGELSKLEFRESVKALGLPYSLNQDDIDAVFDKYDEDSGGFLDEAEAKVMIRGLRKDAEIAEHDKEQKKVMAHRARMTASKKSTLVASPLPEVPADEALEVVAPSRRQRAKASKGGSGRKRSPWPAAGGEKTASRPGSPAPALESERAAKDNGLADANALGEDPMAC